MSAQGAASGLVRAPRPGRLVTIRGDRKSSRLSSKTKITCSGRPSLSLASMTTETLHSVYGMQSSIAEMFIRNNRLNVPKYTWPPDEAERRTFDVSRKAGGRHNK